ncbi:MAG: hypothetical protein RSE24_01160 [Oscillospiraceae bacterium]
MKKLLTIALAGAVALSLCACQGTPKTEETPASDTPAVSSTAYFGKVSLVAGNELELNLAKEPEIPEAESTPPPEPSEDGSVPATLMQPAISGGGGAAQRVEVEYTGEIKSFVIPGGMKIKDAMGEEKQLSDIKKGSIMNIFVDDKGNLTEVFLYE